MSISKILEACCVHLFFFKFVVSKCSLRFTFHVFSKSSVLKTIPFFEQRELLIFKRKRLLLRKLKNSLINLEIERNEEIAILPQYF